MPRLRWRALIGKQSLAEIAENASLAVADYQDVAVFDDVLFAFEPE
jgi:hypothetical protein